MLEGFFFGNKVINNSDGSMRVCYIFVMYGKYILYVVVRGCEIEESFFSVNVVEGIDYIKVGLIFMKIGF